MKTQKNGDAKIFQGKTQINSWHSCEMSFYIGAKEGPNKGSSFSTKLVREIYKMYYGEIHNKNFMEVLNYDEEIS